MNKKLIVTFVMSSLVATAFAGFAGAAPLDKQAIKDEKGKVHNVQGKLGKVAGATAEERALNGLDLVGQDFGFAKAKGNFKVKASHNDENGLAHTKLDQVINGIKVLDHQMIVHELKGDVQGVTGDFAALTPNATSAALTGLQAADKAVASTGFTGQLSRPATSELTYVAQGNQAVLAYKVNVAYNAAAEPANWQILVDAVNGTVISSINTIDHVAGTGTGVLGDTKTIQTTLKSGSYYLEDHSKSMTGDIETYDMKNGTTSGYYYTDADNKWTATTHRAGVDAHYYAGIVFDYYKGLGRNSYDNAGSSIYSYTHYSTNYNNAYWDGAEMVYGDGDGVQFRSLSGAKDVVAHELTHAVTETTSALVYSNQSGALNESWSDAQASVVDGDDWNIGEDVYTPGTAGDALRSMSNPALYGQPATMSAYVNTTSDNGGVHTNSGIPNKAFYNFATAIGSRTIAGKVWYVASRDYMTSSTNFSGARAATLSAVGALYGTTSTYYTSLKTAWSNVGVN
ncbi:M4 family metallopeptidase [Tumebacillus permanentifrigoris]|uniref:Neutral metalloproteinase n=1 Tax=Tumebacillus permanentifrigoris TaxID=378543 RepID=A0A316DFN3_9BACL|nr:M4 family metallopeptidase [Tumebacillus permanentifrigoris]PWK16362.1 thermolysin [Tumebacillus permanentifrigoris]